MGTDPDANGTGPRVDRSSEPWVASFPGLGTVRVGADGDLDVDVDLDAADADAVAVALRHGWGEPLSYVRRGFHLLGGTAVTPPGRDGAILLIGPFGDVELFWLGLAHRGWGVLGDRYVPVTCDEGPVLAVGRSAPPVAVAAWARRAGFDVGPLRPSTDAAVVALPRPLGPFLLEAVAVIEAPRAGPAELREVHGSARMTAVSCAISGIDPAAPGVAMSVASGLAALPQVVVHPTRGQLADSVEALAAWVGATLADRPGR